MSENTLVDYVTCGFGGEFHYILSIVRGRTSKFFEELSDLLLYEEQLQKKINSENQVALASQTQFKGNFGKGRYYQNNF